MGFFYSHPTINKPLDMQINELTDKLINKQKMTVTI